MLTLQDCVDLCDISEDEILAIAEHEHVPEIIAAEIAQYVVHTPDGVPMIRKIILEDIEHARQRGDDNHAAKLRLVLKQFMSTHPEYDIQQQSKPRYGTG
jgi:hypothetical protein